MKKPYKCPFCWNRYGYEHSRALHIRDDHKNILQNPSLMKASESLIEYKAVPEKVLRKFTLIDRSSPGLNDQSPVSSPTMAMPIHSHPSIDGSTGSAGSRESSPADSPAYGYPQEPITHQSNIQSSFTMTNNHRCEKLSQEQIPLTPEMTSPSVRHISVLRHHDVISSNSSHSHLPLRKRPYINAVSNQNQFDHQEIQQPIRRRSTSPTYQRQSATHHRQSPTHQRQSPTHQKSTSPYRISKPLSPVRVPVIVSNPYSGRLQV